MKLPWGNNQSGASPATPNAAELLIQAVGRPASGGGTFSGDAFAVAADPRIAQMVAQAEEHQPRSLEDQFTPQIR